MYWGGLGYAEIPTTYLQSPLFDTTDIETNALDNIWNFRFFCNSTAIGISLPLNRLNPNDTTGYAVIPVEGTDQPVFGCENVFIAPNVKTVSEYNPDMLQSTSNQ